MPRWMTDKEGGLQLDPDGLYTLEHQGSFFEGGTNPMMWSYHKGIGR